MDNIYGNKLSYFHLIYGMIIWHNDILSSYRAKIERANIGSRTGRFSIELHKVFKLSSFLFESISNRAKKRVDLERLTSLELFLQPYLPAGGLRF